MLRNILQSTSSACLKKSKFISSSSSLIFTHNNNNRQFHSNHTSRVEHPKIKPIDSVGFYNFSRDFAIASAKASRLIDLIFAVRNEKNDIKKEEGLKAYSQMMLGLYMFNMLTMKEENIPALSKAISLFEQLQTIPSGSEENFKLREEMGIEFAKSFSSNDPTLESLKKVSVDERGNIVRQGSFLIAYPFLRSLLLERDFIGEAEKSEGRVSLEDFVINLPSAGAGENTLNEAISQSAKKIERISQYFVPELFEKAKVASSSHNHLLDPSMRDAIYHYNYSLLTVLYQRQILYQMARLKKKDLASMSKEDIQQLVEKASSAEFAMSIAGNPNDKLVMAAITDLHIHAV
ncbi:hypothetical protein NAEGRDRAFT_80442 [Naegleria gruberi]|uniref:Uncharacterized protein n=1 Tax=Naegleria gruberi TaxID=5762 RepID=D2VLG4_NAEGR|nr:uncharacterized protein NAEGRDRAFT_80442 [Naegleria gruberi]EFC42307.1 hypothetical protein NAEGRDRAFT_80442 [Naegleria gruberi]|eukprot:XP_002675051.1 hypothetical protein NAEGRDRAFT_80442 [Naegleria gruberi strain NEG-M]